MSEEHIHVQVRHLICQYNMDKGKYSCVLYTFCNECAIKMGNVERFINKKKIPEISGDLVKVTCHILTNGYEYKWFGHPEDWSFYIEHGDKWVEGAMVKVD